MNRKNMALAMLASLFMGTALVAHENATGFVKQRMDAMDSLASSMKVIAGMIRGTNPFDQQEMITHSRNIKTHSGKNLLLMFPEGSLQDVSEAREEIWSRWTIFTELANRMETLADKFEQVAQQKFPEQELLNPDGQLNQIFKKLGQTCAQCHQDFRVTK